MEELKRTSPVRYAIGMFGNSIPINMFNTYMAYFYVDMLGLDMRIYSVALFAYAIFDALDNPVYGYLSDRTRTRWGRRKPWLLAGCPLMLISFVAFFSPPGFLKGGAFIAYFVVFLMLVETFNSLLLTNYGALLPDLFRTDALRTRANAIRQALQVAAMIIAISLTPMLTDLIGYAWCAVLLGVVGMGSLAFSVLGCHESHDYELVKKPKIWESIKEILQNRSFWVVTLTNAFYSGGMSLVLAGLPFYVKYSLGLGGSATTFISGSVLLVAIFAVAAWSRIVKKFSLLRAWRATILVLCLSFIPMFFAWNMVTAIVCGAIIGFGFAGVITTMDVVGAHVLTEDNIKTQNRREGIFQSLGGFLNRLSGVFKSAMFYLVFVFFGFRSGDAPGSNPGMAAKFIMLICPFFLMAVSYILSRLLKFREEL